MVFDNIERYPGSLESAREGLTALTYKGLTDLPAVCIKDDGIYARLMHNRLNLGNQDWFIYVKSASRFCLGLGERIFHISMESSHKTKKHQVTRACKMEDVVQTEELHNLNDSRSRFL